MVASKIRNTVSASQTGQRGRALMELNSRLVRKANKRVRRRLFRWLQVRVKPGSSIPMFSLLAATAITFMINCILSVTGVSESFMPLAPRLLVMSILMAVCVYLATRLFQDDEPYIERILDAELRKLSKASYYDGAIARYAAKLSSVGSASSVLDYAEHLPRTQFGAAVDSVFDEIPDPATADGLQSILEKMGGDSLSINGDDPRTMCLPWHEDLKAALKKGLDPSPESWPLVMYVLDNSLSVNAVDLEPGMEDEFEGAYRKIIDVSDPSVYVLAKKTAPAGGAGRKPADALRDAMQAAGQCEASELDPHAMAMLEQLKAARERLDKISAEDQAVEAAICL